MDNPLINSRRKQNPGASFFSPGGGGGGKTGNAAAASPLFAPTFASDQTPPPPAPVRSPLATSSNFGNVGAIGYQGRRRPAAAPKTPGPPPKASLSLMGTVPRSAGGASGAGISPKPSPAVAGTQVARPAGGGGQSFLSPSATAVGPFSYSGGGGSDWVIAYGFRDE